MEIESKQLVCVLREGNRLDLVFVRSLNLDDDDDDGKCFPYPFHMLVAGLVSNSGEGNRTIPFVFVCFLSANYSPDSGWLARLKAQHHCAWSSFALMD